MCDVIRLCHINILFYRYIIMTFNDFVDLGILYLRLLAIHRVSLPVNMQNHFGKMAKVWDVHHLMVTLFDIHLNLMHTSIMPCIEYTQHAFNF